MLPASTQFGVTLSGGVLWLSVAFWIIALVLIGSGATKVIEPGAFGRFISEITPGRRSTYVTEWIGRVVGVVEVVVGLAALIIGGGLVAVIVALIYAGFAVVVGVAIRSGAASCGCFGSVSSLPKVAHLSMNVISAIVAIVAASNDVAPVGEGVAGLGAGALAVLSVVIIGAGAVIFVDTH